MALYISEISAAGADEIKLTFEMEIPDQEDRQKESFTVPSGFYAGLDIKKGPSSPEIYQCIQCEAEIHAAYKKGMRALHFSSCSKKRLFSKLRASGFSPENALSAVDRIEEQGYLNDAEVAKAEAEKCARKLWGEARIKNHLISKQFSKKNAEEAMLHLEECGIDYLESCKKLLEQKRAKKPKSFEEAQKLFSALARYGYSTSVAKEAISQLKS